MSVVYARPGADTGFQGPGTGTLTGAASIHAALSDNTDASYIRLANKFTDLTLSWPSIPPGAALAGWRLLLRCDQLAAPGHVTLAFLNWAYGPVLGTDIAHGTPTTITPNTGPISAAFLNWLSTSRRMRIWGESGLLNFYELYLGLVYATRPSVEVVGPTGTVDNTNLAQVQWQAALDRDGGPQALYEVKIFDEATYTASGFNPATAPPVDGSGESPGVLTTWTGTEHLPDGDYRAYVRVAQQWAYDAGPGGRYTHRSLWAYSEFTVDIPDPPVPTITAAGDDASARISLGMAEGTGGGPTDYIEVQRSLDGGASWEQIRTLFGDGLFPGGELCFNGKFQSGTEGWSHNLGLEQDPDDPGDPGDPNWIFEAVSGLSATPNGTTTALRLFDNGGAEAVFSFPVLAGETYTVSAQRMWGPNGFASGTGATLGFYDPSGSLKTFAAATSPTSGWAEVSFEVTAEETGIATVRLHFGVQLGLGYPGSGDMYLTDVSITAGEAPHGFDYEVPNAQTALYRARALHRVLDESESFSSWSDPEEASWSSPDYWLKHPTRPSLNLAVPRARVTSQPGHKRPIAQGVHRVLGRSDPIVTTDVRSSAEGEIAFETEGDEQEALEALLSSGVALLIQAPPGDGWPDRWCSLADLDSDRLADLLEITDRQNKLAWTEVKAPLGRLEEA
jgi:hypothetical protein